MTPADRNPATDRPGFLGWRMGPYERRSRVTPSVASERLREVRKSTSNSLSFATSCVCLELGFPSSKSADKLRRSSGVAFSRESPLRRRLLIRCQTDVQEPVLPLS